MLVTKEQQEALVSKYIKEKHSQDECIGFIDGINAALDLTSKISSNQHDVNAKLISASSKMLKALQRVKTMFEHRQRLTGDYRNENLYSEIINVIKNATE